MPLKKKMVMCLHTLYIFKDWCLLGIFGRVQTQPGATEVSAPIDKFLWALLQTAKCLTPSPGSWRKPLSHSGEVEAVLILTLQRKLSPLTSSCPKQGWWGRLVMKGLPPPFDPGTSWAIPAFPGLGNAGPHWLCFLLPIIFMASSGFLTYSVLSKGNCQEVRTGFQKRTLYLVGSRNWFNQLDGFDVANCFLLPMFEFWYCSNLGVMGPPW